MSQLCDAREKKYITFLCIIYIRHHEKKDLTKREKLAPRVASSPRRLVASSKNCTFLREEIFREGAS